MENSTLTFERKKVYDPILRICHWGIVISICLLIGTGLMNDTIEPGIGRYFAWEVHIFSGYIFAGMLTLRIIWGFVGNQFAKWSNMFHFQTWKETFIYLKTHRTMPVLTQKNYGHDPLASLVYLGIYAIFIMMMLTGFMLAGLTHDTGPFASALVGSLLDDHLFEEIHEFGFNVIWIFILLHIGALIMHEKKENIPMAQSMISGYQYRHHQKQEDKS